MDTSDDKVSPTNGESSPKHTFLNKLKNKKIKKILLPFIVMVAALPVIVFAALQQQETRNFAQVSNVTPTQPVLLPFKKAIRFSSEFIYPTNQPLLKAEPSANVTQRSENWTVEGFIRVSPFSGTSQTGGTQPLVVALKEKTEKDKGYVFLLSLDVANTGTSKPKLSLLTNSTNNPDANYTTIGDRSSITLTPDRWYHIAGEFGYVYDTKECYVALWIDGQLAEVLDKGVNECPFSLPDLEKIQLGGNLPFPVPTVTPLPNITLDIDEVRVSGGVLRYIAYYWRGKNFPRPTEPFVADNYTAFLWHFDDNFKDEGFYGYDLDFLSGVVDFIDSDIVHIITAFQDAFVRSDKPSTNFGSGGRLRSDGDPKVISYLKFDLAPVAGKKIASAKLKLTVSNDVGAGSFDTYNLRKITPDDWFEGKVNYNNRPTLGPVLTTFKGKAAGAIIEVDVKNFLGTSNRVSFAIATEGTNELILNSREAGSGNPQLIIEY